MVSKSLITQGQNVVIAEFGWKLGGGGWEVVIMFENFVFDILGKGFLIQKSL